LTRIPIGHILALVSTPNPESVAGEVRAALARRQITQTSLAEATGRSQAYWSKRLNGSVPLDVADLAAVADLTGVPVESLVSGRAA
jgi:transcriptional regulator with XRE-family HTH domain